MRHGYRLRLPGQLFAGWAILTLSIACAAPPPVQSTALAIVSASPTVTSTLSPATVAPSTTPTPATPAKPLTQTVDVIGTPEREPQLATPIAAGASTQLPSIKSLADKPIVDRPLRAMRALTDGRRKYRLAAWAPTGPFVAAVPQDGPGMDLVNVATGQVSAVVSETYVLEPRWTDTGQLLVHRIEGGRDTLTLYDPRSGFAPAPLVAGPPLSAPDYGSGILVFTSAGKLNVCFDQCGRAPPISLASGALATALAPGRSQRALLAFTPEVANLEDVQTFVMSLDGLKKGQKPPEARALSMRGEGLWLPRWSPDGSRLVLTGIGGRLVEVSADGQERQDLGPGDAPAWSPDGKRIAFAGASAGLDYTRRDLYIIPAEGRGPRLRLTDANEEQFYLSPSWSPDGKQLAFVEVDSGKLFVGEVPEP